MDPPGHLPFYQATKDARTELIQAGGEPYKKYKTRLSVALRLLWPKRPESRSPFWRPDWRMSMVAEASVRHWTVAFKAVQASPGPKASRASSSCPAVGRSSGRSAGA
ncbi:hypothetical protein ABZT03_40120 [Streptomyces sp. NPDC005574]|uniref:hypothetical protein n=1 Tax=Streptomyces sp. NPDC005574 TaxID=3156891 RepID=UPI0033BD74A2